MRGDHRVTRRGAPGGRAPRTTHRPAARLGRAEPRVELRPASARARLGEGQALPRAEVDLGEAVVDASPSSPSGAAIAVGGLPRAPQRRTDDRGDVAEVARRPARPPGLRPAASSGRSLRPENRRSRRVRRSRRAAPGRAGSVRDRPAASTAASAARRGRRRASGARDLAGGAVHRLVGEPVGVLVLLARDPLERDVVEPRRSAAASRASARSAGCLTCQVPFICSTTSLESIRTATSPRAEFAGARAARRSARGTRRRCWSRCRCTRCARPAPRRWPASSTTAP